MKIGLDTSRLTINGGTAKTLCRHLFVCRNEPTGSRERACPRRFARMRTFTNSQISKFTFVRAARKGDRIGTKGNFAVLLKRYLRQKKEQGGYKGGAQSG